MIKISIRFFENIPVRYFWEEETYRWWLCVVNIDTLFLSNDQEYIWQL